MPLQPYAHSALSYTNSDLGWPIPSIMPFEKFPPLPGWTGRRGDTPNIDQVSTWADTHPQSNILLRLAPHIIGIDVDAYDDKQGLSTLGQLQHIHGILEPTWKSSARGPGASGIRFYKLRHWMTEDKMRDPGEHIELIRFSHRYAVVAPSWHQGTAAPYRWYLNDEIIDRMPTSDDFPYLSLEWYTHLNRGCACFEQERAEIQRSIRRLSNRPAGEAGAEAAREDLKQAADSLEHMAEGGRNNALSTMAGKFLLYDAIINQVLTAREVAQSLLDAGTMAGLTREETERTIQSALEWALREGDKR